MNKTKIPSSKFELILAKFLHNMIWRYASDDKTGGRSDGVLPENWDDLRETAKAHYIREASKILSMFRQKQETIMDTSKFELTAEEKENCYRRTKFPWPKAVEHELCIAQIAKVLSKLEPVELEVLRKEFIKLLTIDSKSHDARRKDFNQAIFIDPADKLFGGKQVFNDTDLDMVMEKFDQAITTIQHNQSKGQLYRIRE